MEQMSWKRGSERGFQDGPRSLWKGDKSQRLWISCTSSQNIFSAQKCLKTSHECPDIAILHSLFGLCLVVLLMKMMKMMKIWIFGTDGRTPYTVQVDRSEGILRGPRRPKTFLHRKILLHNCTVHSGCYWPCFNGIQWAFNPLNLAKNAPNCAFPLFPLSHKEKRLLKYHDK